MNPFQILGIATGLFLVSLGGAFVVFKWLDGKASFKHQGLKLGGSAAGFAVFFWLLQKVFFVALDKIPTSVYPPLEVIALGPQGQKILSEIILNPKKLIISLNKFNELDTEEYTVLNDSFHIAMSKPKYINWSFGELPEYNTLALRDVPFFVFMNKMTGGALDSKPILARQFGARTGIPTRLTLQESSVVDGIKLGDNPFEDKAFYAAFENSAKGSMTAISNGRYELSPEDSDSLRASLVTAQGKVIKDVLPIKRNIYSGVYISVYSKKSFKANAYQDYLVASDLLTKAVAAAAPYSKDLPRLSYLNGNQQVAAYNKNVELKNIIINNKKQNIIISYIGFAIGGDNNVYTITLQYLSTDSPETLRELQRFFESVRVAIPSNRVIR